MSKIALSGNASGTGTLTIAAPNTSTDRTLTLPDNTGTLVSTGSTAGVSQAMLASGVAGNGPAFSAYASNTLAITGNVSTKIVLNTELFDTNNNFDPTTNYRFTPTVAGYYQINFSVEAPGTAAGYYVAQLKKNGSGVALGANFPTDASFGPVSAGACLVQMNGSTDYLELFVQSSASRTISSGIVTAMSGSLARSS